MAQKRSRATFEADLQAQQSPYVIYGTPLAPVDPETRDDGSYVPVWKQEVTDEQGRKRLHGAFTGGFSAGYFNTVGSKEGWTPSTFVSSRSNRKTQPQKQEQRPEDFMDEEDLAEAEEAQKLQTTDTFAGLGSNTEAKKPEDLMDLLRPTGESMGTKLLKKMGWREGQGIGPKIRRKTRFEDGESMDDDESHLFTPENSKMISFSRKTDRKGLGFEGEAALGTQLSEVEPADRHGLGDQPNEQAAAELSTNGVKTLKKSNGRKGGFGVGVLNDDGSDDDDPYSMGPRISYNRVIGGDKKKKKKSEAARTTANPLLGHKLAFVSKKDSLEKKSKQHQRCHDGRLPIDGFILSSVSDALSSILSQDSKYPPPQIPEGWTLPDLTSPNNPTASTASKQPPPTALSPSSRAALMGEAPLPGKSVFDFMTPSARSRIATATSNQNLPTAGSEAPLPPPKQSLTDLIPALPKETALAALNRGTAGWMPYTEDPAKRSRYRGFLELRAGLLPEDTLPERVSGVKVDDWAKELSEFAHAAQIFKPMSSAMATRFTSSSSVPSSGDVKPLGTASETGELLTTPSQKTKTPAEEAAAAGMYGPLTRSVKNWYPTRLLCKRFNVKPPAHVQVDPREAAPGMAASGQAREKSTHSTALPQKRLELVGKKDMDDLRLSGAARAEGMRLMMLTSAGVEGGSAGDEGIFEGQGRGKGNAVAIDSERNDAIEKERPGEAVFKAIFGSDSEDD
ncbi:uncharacterized protein KY384_002107 [Bacidia gigantensis]|uniref:uncharacterized protein n=1 Tax=Bacidia gigantensis TaxID=2732470 RepID=UPI001D04E5BB|nr:uncharacterized protein KY384_002107 [Bacidia gigantensis]KAG8533324.1 hypothetical protein KY384_002107 [Bacidia gigantensis]